MSTNPPFRFWMVRTASFKILRPIEESVLLGMIEKGELHPQDEVCSSTGYWFSLNDLTEIRAHFGEISVHALFPRQFGDEITASNETKSIAPSEAVVKTLKEALPHRYSLDQVVRFGTLIFMMVLFVAILFWFWSHGA